MISRAPLAFAAAAARRAGWGFADQALSSFTNFLLGFVVARSVGPADFGAYSLAFAIYLLALNAARAVTSLPLTIRYSRVAPAVWADACRGASSLALLCGLAAGLVCLGSAAVTEGSISVAFWAFGLIMPALLLQDFWRFAFFARGTGSGAFLNDAVWTAVQIPLFIVLLAGKPSSLAAPILIWGGSALVAALIGGYQAALRPHFSRTIGWWRAHRDIASRLLGESLVSTGGTVLQPYGLTAIAGLTVVGALRAGQLIVGPFNVVFQGTTLVAIPAGAQTLRASAERLRHACLMVSVALAAAALGFSVVLLSIPESVGVELLRANWAPARGVLPALCVALIGLGATSGATIGMRVLAAVKRSFPTRIFITLTSLAAVITGGAAAGAPGAAAAIALMSCLGTVVWWRQFLAALDEYVAPTASGYDEHLPGLVTGSEGSSRGFAPPTDP